MRASVCWTTPAIAALALAAPCVDEGTGDTDAPRLLAFGFTEELHVGDDPSERQFADITSMAFSPSGELAVLDSREYAVSVFDLGGGEIAQWGNQGGIVRRVAPPVPLVRRMERAQVHRVHQVAHMMRQVTFRNPFPKVRWQHQNLVRLVEVTDVLPHDPPGEAPTPSNCPRHP